MTEQLRAGNIREFKTVHLCGGIGGCDLGMNQAKQEYRGVVGTFRTLFSLDNDPGACEAHRSITGNKAVCADMFSREQYILFHGQEPPADWNEITPADMRAYADGEYPDVIFISAPCKGFSRLLPNAAAQKPKYQALNGLLLRAMELSMGAWGDDPPAVILIENVPGIETRGAEMLQKVKTILSMYGYVFHAGHHDCGEIGNLGQRRVRYLMIARQPKKLPSFIYQPPKLGHRTIGDVLGPLPMPGDMEHGGKMHRLPNLAWKTWERLALIPAGKDWRALKDLNHTPQNGTFRIVPWDGTASTVTAEAVVPGNASSISVADPRLGGLDGYGNKYAVSDWDKTAPTVTGNRTRNGGLIVNDPRAEHYNNILKVCDWNEPGAAVTGGSGVMSGGLSVADPRTQWSRYKVVKWEEPSPAVVGQANVKGSALSVADPRFQHPTWKRTSVGKVQDWNEPSGAVIASPNISGAGSASVADPRISEKWSGAGNFKVMPWDEPSNAMTAHTDIHAGAAAVADPRIPGPDERGIWIIMALDGTWHRPITTFEMAMLQGLPQILNGKPLELPGNSDARWREWIGNMVPVPAATAMGNALLATMMPNYAGDWHWDIDGNDVWVREHRKENYDVKLQRAQLVVDMPGCRLQLQGCN